MSFNWKGNLEKFRRLFQGKKASIIIVVVVGHCHLKRQNAVTITTEYCLTFVVKHIKKHTLFVYLQTEHKKSTKPKK